VRLVHKQPIHAQLFKGNDIILSFRCPQLFQSCLQGFSSFFHLLDCEILAALVFQFRQRIFNLFNLLRQYPLLSLCRYRDFFKLTVADNHRIVIAGGNPRAEFFPISRFKILFTGHQQLRAGIQP